MFILLYFGRQKHRYLFFVPSLQSRSHCRPKSNLVKFVKTYPPCWYSFSLQIFVNKEQVSRMLTTFVLPFSTLNVSSQKEVHSIPILEVDKLAASSLKIFKIFDNFIFHRFKSTFSSVRLANSDTYKPCCGSLTVSLIGRFTYLQLKLLRVPQFCNAQRNSFFSANLISNLGIFRQVHKTLCCLEGYSWVLYIQEFESYNGRICTAEVTFLAQARDIILVVAPGVSPHDAYTTMIGSLFEFLNSISNLKIFIRGEAKRDLKGLCRSVRSGTINDLSVQILT